MNSKVQFIDKAKCNLAFLLGNFQKQFVVCETSSIKIFVGKYKRKKNRLLAHAAKTIKKKTLKSNVEIQLVFNPNTGFQLYLSTLKIRAFEDMRRRSLKFTGGLNSDTRVNYEPHVFFCIVM